MNNDDAAQIAQALVTSPEYRASIMRRIKADRLPAQVEVILHYLAWGLPPDLVEEDEEPAPKITRSAVLPMRRKAIAASEVKP
jgi:hypothetical protein